MGKEVKKILIDKGLSIADLARITGFTRGHLSGVINGRYKSERAQKVIALALRKDFSELWAPEQESQDASAEHN
ncbi:MAG: helix-turn-helix transcriptional regulator [Syntrophobacteraceae bacterium]|jgi:transcriptional regulator with XRE-family HTH domain